VPKGNIIVERRVLTTNPNFATSEKKISPTKAFTDGTIEDSDADWHADFANEYIGGGALIGGNVQEEILFVIKPECLVSMLFCAKMDQNEAIMITGAERYSKYTGYGHSFRWGGPYFDTTKL
jgi:poly(ADP-ribose) glycohydrolase